MRDEQRRRRSQYDRGTSLAEREEYVYDGYEAIQEEYPATSPYGYQPCKNFFEKASHQYLTQFQTRLPFFVDDTHAWELYMALGVGSVGPYLVVASQRFGDHLHLMTTYWGECSTSQQDFEVFHFDGSDLVGGSHDATCHLLPYNFALPGFCVAIIDYGVL
jgi:hypothetical protein